MCRIQQLELLDELEEWYLLAEHYGVIWAWRTTSEQTTSSWHFPHTQ
jgi:hypothetical protein